MIANLIGAGVGAILPVVMEAVRNKPDPEAAKAMLRSQRQGRVEEAIGAGMSMQQAEKQVDAQLEQEFKQADEAGEFNTPWGEMVAGALLGGAVPWAAGKISGMAKGAGDAGKAAVSGADDAVAAAGPSPMDVKNAMSGGMPLTMGKAVVNKGSGASPQMMGAPFPEAPVDAALAGMPLTMSKAAKPPRASNVDVMAMLSGSPFPR